MEYRKEIDGLRAIAVISVIFYHAEFKWSGGGYVGVDVFFVVSGYLITSIILTESDAGGFSITRFYERRVRRILPALFLVMLCCLPFAWFLLVPNQLIDFSKSLVAVSVFLSNFLFWNESGYFDLGADEKPLLHTWSLAVEEQFYVFFPLFIILFRRLGTKWLVGIIAIGAAISICLAQFGGNLRFQTPFLANRLIFTDVADWAFYLAPARAWELLFGALSAFYVLHVASGSDRRQPNNRMVGEAAGLIGLALIGYAIVAFNFSTPFPSFYTLIPVLGTVLIILYADRDTLAHRILSTNVLVKIGLISYSAYLWHYPIFAFARISNQREPSFLAFCLLIVISIGLAYVSWRYIERPFRQRENFSRTQMFAGGLVGSLIFIAVGLVGYFVVQPDVPKTQPRDTLASCENFVPTGDAQCRRKPADPTLPAKAPIVIWGDSHGRVYEEVASAYGGEVYIVLHFGCPPIVGVVRDDKIGTAKNCESLDTLKGYADYINALKPKAVILIGRWHLYLHGLHKRGMLQRETSFLSTDPNAPKNSPEVSVRTVKTQLAQTLAFLRAPQVLFVAQVPDLSDIGTAEYIYRKLNATKVSVKDIANYKTHDLAIFEAIVNKFDKARIVPTRDLFCDALSCTIFDGKQLLYYDDNHVTRIGAARVFDRILKNIH